MDSRPVDGSNSVLSAKRWFKSGQTILQVTWWWCKGGTWKAEAAKLPGAGIGPKQCPEKCAAEKGYLPKSVSIGVRSRLELSRAARIIRTARRPSDRLAMPAAQGETQQATQWQPKRWLLP